MAICSYLENDNEIEIFIGDRNNTHYKIGKEKKIAILFYLDSDRKTKKKMFPFSLFLKNENNKPKRNYEYTIKSNLIKLKDGVNQLHPYAYSNWLYLNCDSIKVSDVNNSVKIATTKYKNKSPLYPDSCDINFNYWNMQIDQGIGDNGEYMKSMATMDVMSNDWYKHIDIYAFLFPYESYDKIDLFVEKYEDEYDRIFEITLTNNFNTHYNDGMPLEVLKIDDVIKLK